MVTPHPSPFETAAGWDPRRLGVRIPHGLQQAKNPATVRRIVAAAEGMFAGRGLAGARTNEIARAARVNKALLYYYFGSKENLYQFVLELLFSQLLVAVESAPAADALPREQLLAYVNGYFDFVAGHPNYPRLVQREVMDSGKHLAWIVQRYFRPLHRRLSRAIEAGIAAGDFRPVEARQTVLTIIAMTVFYFAAAPVLSEMWGRDALRPQAVAARRRAILDFLEHGLFRPASRQHPVRSR
jgi:TetR/AcrR family transcriptional regulator